MNEYRVYTLKLCRYLTERGFNYTRIVQDVKNATYYNWLFNETPELRVAIEEYTNGVRQNETNRD